MTKFSVTRFYRMRKLTFIHARLFPFDANILKFIGGRRSRGCRGLPFESGNTLIHPCPFVWRNVYSLIHRDARRRLIYQIPKSRSSPRFPFSETRARRNVIPRRDAIQSLYRSDHVLQWVHLRHCDSRRAPDITCTLLDELRTMLLMEIYIHGRSGNVAGTKWLNGRWNVRERKVCRLFRNKLNVSLKQQKKMKACHSIL